MPIYEKSTKELMADWAKENLSPGQVFNRADAVRWFKQNYPLIKDSTVRMHVDGMSVNNPVRAHHPNIRKGSGHDLFWKLGPKAFRLWNPDTDEAPRYKEDFEAVEGRNTVEDSEVDEEETDSDESSRGSAEFAAERDLQNYLAKNLSVIEPGLHLYEDEGLTGIEFQAGGRRIDILAVGQDGGYVVIELKVSRGYDRVIGQLLRYMGWIEKNLAEGKPVRGIIVAKDITEDLKLASSRISGIKLIEYEISFSLRQV
ncbi:MAG: DUF91 domain-containing protein [Rhodobiaceae bacterium]|nr:DUF91 domain-containing protein [Rhodobiaceae bacterium]